MRRWLVLFTVLAIWVGLAILPGPGSFEVGAQVGPANRYHASSTTCTTIEKMLVDGNASRVGLRILNLGPENLYVGGQDIAPTRGFPVHSGTGGLVADHILVLSGPEASGGLFCVADGTVTVKIFQAIR